MYIFVDFISQIALGGGGSLVPQTRGSHTPIWCAGLVVTLKIDIIIIMLKGVHLLTMGRFNRALVLNKFSMDMIKYG
jgi:hypothetical protein